MKHFFSLALALALLAGLLCPAPVAAGDRTWTPCFDGIWGADVLALAASPGYAADHTLFAGTTLSGFYRSTDSGAHWGLSKSGLTQDVKFLAVSPALASDHTLFAGGAYGTLFRSTNGGSAWASLPAYSGAIYSLAISPNFAADRTILGGSAHGVLRSTDRGNTFSSASTGLPNTAVYGLAFSPNYASDRKILAGTYKGLFYSTNGGNSWNGVAAYADVLIYSIDVTPASAGQWTAVAATWGKGVLKSTNGSTWTQTSTTVTGNRTYLAAISPNYAADSTMIAFTQSAGVVRSTNGGSAWSPFNTGLPKQEIRCLLFSPTYASDHKVYAGTPGGVFVSVNGGAWAFTGTGLTTPNVPAVAVSPVYATDHTVFASTGWTGVFRSTNSGGSWTPVNSGLSDLSVMSLAIAPNFAGTRTLFAGTTQNFFRSGNAGDTWTLRRGGYAATAIAVSNTYSNKPHVVFGGSSGVLFSEDGGYSWDNASVPAALGTVGALEYVVWGDYWDHTRACFAATSGKGVLKGVWPGSVWYQSNTGLTDTNVCSLAMSPKYASDQTVFAGTRSEGIFKSTNAGASWAAVDPSSSHWVAAMEISPYYDADRTIVAGTWYYGVFASTNGGDTWSAMNDGLVSRDIRVLAITPTSPLVIYAGTAGGVWQYTTTPRIYLPLVRRP